MREYVVYREGWDQANQDPDRGLPEKMAVARIFANSPEEACRSAAGSVRVTDDQRLTAEPADVVDAREASLNVTTPSRNIVTRSMPKTIEGRADIVEWPYSTAGIDAERSKSIS